MMPIYTLSHELSNDPGLLAATQALTLNEGRPRDGLKGTFGLFGSPEWWSSIVSGRIRKQTVSGVITRVYVAGQDPSELPNAIDMRCDDGSTPEEGIYVNSEADTSRYQVGKRVTFVYVLDELKARLAGGSPDYLDIVLEVHIEE